MKIGKLFEPKQDNIFPFDLEIIRISNKRNISISIGKNKLVKIRCPNNLSEKHLFEVIEKKRNWISKKINFIENSVVDNLQISNNKIYKDNDIIYFLGKSYQIKIIDSIRNFVEIHDDKFLFVSKYPKINEDGVKKIINRWLENQAAIIFRQRLIINHNIFCTEHPCVLPQLKIKKMKSKWGSMSTRKLEMLVNFNLIYLDIKFIDFVIIHELCHIKHQNHSASFYNLKAKFIPNWQQIRNELKIWGYNVL